MNKFDEIASKRAHASFQLESSKEELDKKEYQKAYNRLILIQDVALEIYNYSLLKKDLELLVDVYKTQGKIKEEEFKKTNNLVALSISFGHYQKALRLEKEMKTSTEFNKTQNLKIYLKIAQINSILLNEDGLKLMLEGKKYLSNLYKKTKRNEFLVYMVDYNIFMGDFFIKTDLKKTIYYFKQSIKIQEKLYYELHTKKQENKLIDLYKKMIECLENTSYSKLKTKYENLLYHIVHYN